MAGLRKEHKMGCIYSDSEGTCQMFAGPETRPQGCDIKGFCDAENDPEPSWCDTYESDSICSECGGDMNTEECECD